MQTLIDGFDKISQTEEKMLSKMTHFAQYDDIPYVADFKCPECGKSGEGYTHKPGGYVSLDKGKLIGYCSTPYGYQMVFECPHCFTKYRYHNCTTGRNDWASFKSELFLVWILEDDNSLA